MWSTVIISDRARIMLEEERDRRIKAGWKSGYSLEQIATEAIMLFMEKSNYVRNRYRDSNEPLEEGF